MMDKTTKKLNFVFWGTPDVASKTLDILKENGYMPSLIITSPDKPQGRKMLLTPPPVKVWAQENNIPYIQPETLKDHIPKEGLRGNSPKSFFGGNIDFFLVVAYGKIIPEEIINMPKLGSINIHYSLLPRYRGASPVESAILNGDTETGITIQKMEYKMDSGPIIGTEEVDIFPEEKASEFRERLIKIGGELLLRILPDFINGKIVPVAQDETRATFCKKIKKEDGLIDLNADAKLNYNKFRAYSTWPRTFFFVNDKRIIITDAVLKNEQFIIKKVLPEGKKEKKYEDFLKNTI